MLCTKYGCDYQVDLDGQVTCTQCGAMDDDKEPIYVWNSAIDPKAFENQVDFE